MEYLVIKGMSSLLVATHTILWPQDLQYEYNNMEKDSALFLNLGNALHRVRRGIHRLVIPLEFNKDTGKGPTHCAHPPHTFNRSFLERLDP